MHVNLSDNPSTPSPMPWKSNRGAALKGCIQEPRVGHRRVTTVEVRCEARRASNYDKQMMLSSGRTSFVLGGCLITITTKKLFEYPPGTFNSSHPLVIPCLFILT